MCARGQRRRSYETLKANRRISNKKYRITKCGIASLCHFYKKSIGFFTWTFFIPCSIFDIRFLRLTGRLRPETVLTPDT
ncbi:hypothetical protein D1AOALGA4SA_4115 [Olavius algarvensis Delta 1 endosymbiont]|nr:hypothetical protein D1AOALGA4SA_4115 [Olavius algarvensis Delta 1 endosymbiont]